MENNKPLKPTEHIVDVSGAAIFCRKTGTGPSIVLLHGFNQSNRLFALVEKELAKRFTVILIDSRGHGQSGITQEKITTLLMAKDVVDVLDHFKINKCCIIGFSDGGNTALQMGVSFPERVWGIVPIGSNAQPQGLKRKILLLFKIWNCLLICASRLSIKAATSQLSLMPLLLEQPQLKKSDLNILTTKCFLIWAAHDYATSEHIASMGKEIQNSETLIVKKSTHLSIMKKWSKYENEVLLFIDSILMSENMVT